MKLITHLHLVQRLRMSGARPTLPYLPSLHAQGLYQRIARHGNCAGHNWRKFMPIRKKSLSAKLPWDEGSLSLP
jgi:hypothetical protein